MKLITRITIVTSFFVLGYIGHYLVFGRDYVLAEESVSQMLPVGTPFRAEIEDGRKLASDHGSVIREIFLAVVVCGDRTHETLVMLKSAILFSPPHRLRVVIVTETSLMDGFKEKLSEWKTVTNDSFTFELHNTRFPEAGAEEWRKLFKPCASQRLFLPSLLNHLDSVLYVDTDVVFVAPLAGVWSHFDRMNSTQLAALTPEHEDPNTGWYNRFSKHPYYGKLGVNSGVMLMNLTRMREFAWESYLVPILKEFKLKITWGDQDIINIIFHYHPERLYVYDCRHNYRSDHCMYMSVCRSAERWGARVLHGSRGTFHSDRQPAFKAVFSAIEQYQLGTDAYHNLLLSMEAQLETTTDTNCGKVASIFLKEMRKYFAPTDGFSGRSSLALSSGSTLTNNDPDSSAEDGN